MIAPDNHMAVMAALFCIAGVGFLGEKTRIGSHLTGAVISILAAMLAANLGLMPHSAPAYGFVFSYIVPALVPLFLFQADLRRMFFETGRTTLAFALATVGTVCGVALAAGLLDLHGLAVGTEVPAGRGEGAVMGLFASTYIGGSVNFAAMGEVTGLASDPSFFSAATAADNLFGSLYLGLLALLPAVRFLQRFFPPHDHAAAAPETREDSPVTAMSLTLSLALALLVVALGDMLVRWLSLPDWRYVIITAITLCLATGVPGLSRKLAGSFELGVGLSFVFFAAIAAGADVVAMVDAAPALSLLAVILLLVHAVITFGVGSLLRFSLPELVTASNAAILGATTAPALAAARGWKNLVTPGVLAGVFGYAVGTFIGTVMFKYWPG